MHEQMTRERRTHLGDSLHVTRIYFTNGQNLKPIQRAGLIVLSTSALSFALDLSIPKFMELGIGGVEFVLTSPLCLLSFVIGGFGLRNALRFKHRTES